MRVNFLWVLVGIWLALAGVLIVLGDRRFAETVAFALIPLTLVAMGLWMLIRARRYHRLEKPIPKKQIAAEALFALILLIVFVGLRKNSDWKGPLNWMVGFYGRPVATRYQVLPETVPLTEEILYPRPTIAPNQTRPPNRLPTSARTVYIRQVGDQLLNLELSGSSQFSWSEPSIRALALDEKTIRMEIFGKGHDQAIHLKVPFKASLVMEATQLAALTVRNMEGDVYLSYRGTGPMVTIATQGNVTVYSKTAFDYTVWRNGDLLILPGPKSTVQLDLTYGKVRVEALQSPAKPWSIKVQWGSVLLALPSLASAKITAVLKWGNAIGPLRLMRVENGHYTYTADITTARVPIEVRLVRGDVTLLVR
ncbi:MAG: hypothetical protein NZ959_03030 [Armatimonadetes bacterium]|nr:hypothetical protein [Armatimonadota bacterium]MDW8121575.1 hypothetical protein [Armatimonadota bacterium]